MTSAPSILVRRSGSALVPADEASERVVLSVPDKTILKVRFTRARNRKGHALFFARIAKAAETWPEAHEPMPDGDAERLRAWLICAAGAQWRDTFDFPVEASYAAIALLDRLRRQGLHAFVREGVIGGDPALRVFVPKTINWAAMGESDFRGLAQQVYSIMESVLGVEIEQLLPPRGQGHAGGQDDPAMETEGTGW